MSILVDKNTKVLVQGITGNEGAFHTRQMIEYGTNIVAGVTPGKGGGLFEGIPVFNTVFEAKKRMEIDATAIFVPPPFAADAILEAVESGIKIIVCLTEGIPILDMLTVFHYVKSNNAILIGPNTPGIISPGECKIGVMAGYIHRKGPIGIISRSGTLTYEVVYQLTNRGIGQSTCIGIGGDPIVGLKYVDLIKMFEKDDETELIVMIGEIGGNAEEEAAQYYRNNKKKPVVAFIAGVTAPPNRRMGHAGAIITGGRGDAATKIKTLEEAGIIVVKNPAEIWQAVVDALQKKQCQS
ncbi:MAG TPA: succinate--CoA ligase subunit alpha [Syntrophorhabdaceae bacterium]|nr:succinate--CoA ligase subunit alpha [Syntrophorhabdaceae bacterium]